MANNRARSRQSSARIAFCGMMSALSIVFMLSGGLIPIATYCSPMISGVLLLPVLIEYGKKAAWTSYACVALLSLFMGTDKEAAFFFLFLGNYPILKWEFDRIKHKGARFLAKLLYFNAAVIVMYLILGFVFNMDALIQEFAQMGTLLLIVFLAMLNACLFLYDRLLFPLVFLYVNKLRPRLNFLK